MTAANTIARIGDVAVANGKLTTTAPRQSITLFVIPTGSGNTPPAIQSPATATPNPASAGQSVTFSVAAGDVNGDALTYNWDFGDGVTGTGATTMHTYSAAGTYNVSVAVSDGMNAPVSSALILIVTESGATINPLTLNKLQIKLNFSRSSADSIMLGGTLPIPAGFQAKGQPVDCVIGSITKVLTLDAKGHARSGGDQFMLGIKAKNGVAAAQTAKFSAKFTGSFAAQLAGILPNADGKMTVSVPVSIVFNGGVYQKTQSENYSAKKGKSGTAK
jgi:PKD repeat protein